MTWLAVEPPFQERAGVCAPLVAREVAERVWREGAPEAPEDEEGFSPQRPAPQEATAGERRGVRVDGKGVPMIKAAAVQLQATWGPGEQRPQKTAARGGAAPRAHPSHARPKRGRKAWSSRKRRAPAGHGTP